MALKFGFNSYSTLMALVLIYAIPGQAYASRGFIRGANGSVGAYHTQGQYGARMGARFMGPNAGAGFRQSQYAGPKGGSLNSAGNFAYKNGDGGVHNGSWSGQAPNGATGSGYSHSQYNSQTGQGNSNSSEQFVNSSGKDFGYTGNTSFTKGQGGSSVIQTDNHGAYDVNFAQGQKPVVTPVQ